MVNPCLEKALTGFHHQEVWKMAGMVPERQLDRTWVYSPIDPALETVVLDDIGVYITSRQNTVAQ